MQLKMLMFLFLLFNFLKYKGRLIDLNVIHQPVSQLFISHLSIKYQNHIVLYEKENLYYYNFIKYMANIHIHHQQ